MASVIESALPSPSLKVQRFLALLGGISLPILILDQITKQLVRAHLQLYQSIALIPNYLDLTYTMNPGAAFSLFVDSPPWFRSAFLFALAAIAIVVLVVLLARASALNLSSFSIALILAGAAGNLIDRLIYGEVIDFIHVHYYTHSYPIFNVADSAISIGVGLVLFSSLFLERHSK